MLEHTAKDIKAENKRKEFSENYGDSDKKLQKAILGQKDYNPSKFLIFSRKQALCSGHIVVALQEETWLCPIRFNSR